MKIATVQFEFSLKHYDYLLDEETGFTAVTGMKLKKPRGFSKWGPLYSYLTIVDLKETDVESFPKHVTALMVVNKDAIISTYTVTPTVIERVNCKYTIGSRGTCKVSSDITDIKHLAYLHAASVIGAGAELSTVYYIKADFQEKVNALKDYQRLLLEEIIEVYNRNDKHIRLDKKDCSADYFIGKLLSSKDDETTRCNSEILLSTLLTSFTKKDYVCWEASLY